MQTVKAEIPVPDVEQISSSVHITFSLLQARFAALPSAWQEGIRNYYGQLVQGTTDEDIEKKWNLSNVKGKFDRITASDFKFPNSPTLIVDKAVEAYFQDIKTWEPLSKSKDPSRLSESCNQLFFPPRLASYLRDTIIYTDFDGTLTSLSGKTAGYFPFMKRIRYCLEYPTKVEIKEKLQETIDYHFGVFNTDTYRHQDAAILMNSDTVEAFHQLLKNPKISVNILTKNSPLYVEAVFRYQAFTEEEIKKINIVQAWPLSKGDVLEAHLTTLTHEPKYIYIFDDEKEEYKSMMKAAAKASFKNQPVIKGYQLEPGNFLWKDYAEEMQTQRTECQTMTIK